jgi:precorrin-6Y C5,15-methyltransferase (decarboxylating)
MSPHPLVVIGIGHDGAPGLSAEALNHVASARVLAGGRRHLDFFPDWVGERLVIDADLRAVLRGLRQRYTETRTVVLASGDPLFYGIGRALLEAFPSEDLLFLPHLSSVQLAFARIKEPWDDARVVSLHGRPMEALQPALAVREPKIAVLTDGKNHPAAIADFVCRQGAGDEYGLWVCENLGGPDERVSRHEPARMSEATYSPLNVVLLLRRRPQSPGPCPRSTGHRGESGWPLLGLPEDALLHRQGRRGLITGREVRLLALCRLELHAGDVLWDVGAGSGSVAIEAARLSPTLRAFAVERDEEVFQQLEANAAALTDGRVRTVHAEAPDGLTDLPDPDAVFIGGSGGRLREVLDAVVRRLKPGGRVVLNCITLETLAHAWDRLCQLGLRPEATSVQLAHSRPLGRWHSLEPESLIFIVRASKP